MLLSYLIFLNTILSSKAKFQLKVESFSSKIKKKGLISC